MLLDNKRQYEFSCHWWQRWDLVDMPVSSHGHVAICTLVDAATGFVIANPVKDKTSHGVSQTLLQKFIPYFGVPKELITDKGTENLNKEIKHLTQAYNIQHIASSTAHPQSNGMVERRQQMILNYVRKNIETLAEQGIWHEMIPDFQTIVNSTVSKSRGFSPFFLTFFRHANFPFTSLVTERPSLGEHNTMHARINFSQKILKQAEGVNAEMFKANKMSYDLSLIHI